MNYVEMKRTVAVFTVLLAATMVACGGGGDGGKGNGGGGAVDSGGGGSDAATGGAPVVQAEATYKINKSTHTYAKGLSHKSWRGEVAKTMDLILDVYEPEGAPAGRPAVILIHGGSFTGGSRKTGWCLDFAEHFASRGFVVASIDYRVAGDFGTLPENWFKYTEGLEGVTDKQREQVRAMYPAARDAKAAVRWLHANAETYKINPGFFSVIGGSAGSYITIAMGVTDAEDFRDELTAAEDSTLASTNLDAAADVHTIVDHWGGVTIVEVLAALDKRDRFDDKDAPVSIIHGTADPTVPFTEAEKLKAAYEGTGVPFDWHPVQNGKHAIWGKQIDGKSLDELAFAFVLKQQGLGTNP